MRRQSKISKILKDKTGASMIFVLGTMLLLMTIGVSVLVSASANTGFVLKQKEYSQILLLEDSIQKNIMYSLQHDETNPELLSMQLAMAIYSANDPDNLLGYTPSDLRQGIPLTIDGVDLGGYNVDITLSFPEQNVVISPSDPAIYIPDIFDDEGNLAAPRMRIKDRDAKTAAVSAKMIVTVLIGINGKTAETRAIYEYNGGCLSDDPNGIYIDIDSGIEFDMVFTDGGYGNWRLIKHENIDSKDQ